MVDQYALLKRKGVTGWNQWRKRNPDLKPNLSGADLRETLFVEADLSWVNLSGADLSRARLVATDFRRADLRGAALREVRCHLSDLSWVNLSGADLRNAVFDKADLSETNLSGADLSGADLRNTFLSEADLSQADFSNAQIGWTRFADVDLSAVIGLETVRHIGPSTIGIDTLYKSHGKIPEAFLRGAGVPETFIAQIGSHAGRVIEFYSCFISYSSKDQKFAERLHADLQSQGVRCWFAPEDLKIGDLFQERIEESIRLFDKVMIILSEASVQSAWVEREVNAARERENCEKRTVLFPIRIDDTVTSAPQPWAADIRGSRHIGDFCRWKNHSAYKKALSKLIRDLNAS